MTACAYCGREGRWQNHHLTGKDDQNRYLDPKLTVPACHDDHTLSSDDWNTFRLMTVDGSLPWVERVELRLRRLGCEFARMDLAQGGETLWGRLAEACARWANELRRYAGGTYAFCDTDSMAIVCHPDQIPIDCPTSDGTNQLVPLHPGAVRRILDRFEPLNPYDPDLIPRLWKEEHDSLKNPVWCYAISAKRYALYRRDPDGTPTFLRARDSHQEETEESEQSEEGLVTVSEHGLGAYVNPYGPDAEPRDRWIREAWGWIITDGNRDTLPDWANTPALTRFSLSSPTISPWFEGYNQRQPRDRQVRPAGFGLIAHPDALTPDRGDGPPRLAAPYDPNPDQWLDLPWYDRNTGKRVEITTLQPGDPGYLAAIQRGAVRVRTIGDVVGEFRKRPEHKSLAPHGAPAGSDTRGLLQRRPIESAPVLTDLTGKEGNQLEERAVGLATNPDAYRSAYGNRGDRWTELVLPVLREIGVEDLMRLTGKSRSTVYNVLSGSWEPKYGGPASVYRSAAMEEVRSWLVDLARPAPRNDYGALWLIRRLRDSLE